MEYKILIIEDDLAFGKMLQLFLERKKFKVSLATSGKQARELLNSSHIDLLITDLKLPDDSGMELLKIARKHSPPTPTILMTSYADVTTAVEAIKRGAADYISKPFRPEELLMVMEQALEKPVAEQSEKVTSNGAKSSQPSKKNKQNNKKTEVVAGNSEASVEFNRHLKLVAPTDMCVLIEGESGTGKEVAAQAIHNQSKRNKGPFVAVDCGAIPEEIAASEFFGHIKGSFTGAINDKKGHFEAANGGTLFLDEVGNLSYQNQMQLLRALQERKIKPVGGNKEIQVDVRIVSATNEDLLQAVEEGRFREDLYHRLNEFSVNIPPLRERKDDLLLFADFFLQEANKNLNKEVLGLSAEAQQVFFNYSWPGNLRELRNIIRRAVLLTTDSFIPLEVLPKEVRHETPKRSSSEVLLSKEEYEKQSIIQALEKTNNNKSEAARLLNIARKTLYNKLKQYGLDDY